MAKNKIEDLRDHLFAALEELGDKENPMEVDRARAISDVAKVLVELAKVEVDLVKAVGGVGPGSKFFGEIPEESRALSRRLTSG